MSFIPTAKIYQSDGVTLLYTISHIMTPIDGWPNKTTPNQVVLSNLRSQGEIIIPAGNLASDIVIVLAYLRIFSFRKIFLFSYSWR